MATNIATTPSQSRRLLECGVDPETADMHWYGAIVPRGGSLTSPPEPSEEWDLFNSPYGFMPEEMQKAKLMEDYNEIIPAWSLSTLLSLLPKEIDIDGYAYRISIYFENPDEPVIGNQWCLCYKPKKHNEKSRIDDVPRYAPDLIECAVMMIEWLTANNYKLNQL